MTAVGAIRPVLAGTLRLGAALLAWGFLALAWLPVGRGLPAGLDVHFLLAPPRLLGAGGGIGSVLLATGILLVLSAVLLVAGALPVGIGLWLARRENWRWPDALADMLLAVPSIVFGLVMLTAARAVDLGPSLMLGAATLSIMVLPLFARGIGEALSNLDPLWHRGAAALGLPLGLTIRRILLPRVLPAIREAFLLALGRAAGETAALLLVVGTGFATDWSPLSPQRVLSVHITELALHVPGGRPQAFRAAAVLAVLVLLMEWPLFAGRRSDS
ncbi:MAG: ABC transporter permease subunit [Alphaproteobacteria bacterium]|nr:MAG: ABC transporter permease subunit [Alphaproteobacteria bacterium]